MDPLLLIRGAVIGLSVAAPIGPVGILCIRRTLAQGFRAGVVSGLGAATVHAIYGVLALYGVAAVAAFVVTHRAWLLAADIAVLVWLGHRIFRAAPHERSGLAGQGVLRAYVSTFSLTVVNPMTVLAFASWIAGLTAGGAGAEDEPLAARHFSGFYSVVGGAQRCDRGRRITTPPPRDALDQPVCWRDDLGVCPSSAVSCSSVMAIVG